MTDAEQAGPGNRLPPPGNRLAGIEALRGIAAVMVVLSHAARHVDQSAPAPGLITLFQAGHSGVDLFFAISGFIILHVHGRDIGHPARLRHYAGRRFSRVMPLYWIGLALTVAIDVAAGHGLPSAADLAWAVALLPTVLDPVMGIAWTLQYELVFYVVFAAMILRRGLGWMLLGAWLAMFAASLAGAPMRGVAVPLYGAYCLEFFMGMGAAWLLGRIRLPAPAWMAAAGGLFFAASYGLECTGVLNGYGPLARLTYGIPASMLVLGLAAADGRGARAVPGWLGVLGGASYSIYLFQFAFIAVAWQAWKLARLPQPAVVLFVVLAGAAILGGIMASRLVEKPMLRLMRRRRPALAPQSV